MPCVQNADPFSTWELSFTDLEANSDCVSRGFLVDRNSKKKASRMPNDDPRNLFLQYYGEYIDAKEQNHPNMTWLKAVHCRAQLQKIGGDPDKEAQICRDIFTAFVPKEQAEKIYRDLYDDSRSYPGM